MDLMDIPEVRNAAIAEYGKDIRTATNKVSDALGFIALILPLFLLIGHYHRG